MENRRRKYSAEFKQDAVRAALRGDRTLSQVARDLGVERSLLQGWKKDLEREVRGDAAPAEETLEQELRRLRRENASLKEDKEILEKAAAFFAKEHR